MTCDKCAYTGSHTHLDGTSVPYYAFYPGIPAGPLDKSLTCTRKHVDGGHVSEMVAALDKLGYRVVTAELMADLYSKVEWMKESGPRTSLAHTGCQYVGGSRYCKRHDQWHAA